MEIRNLVSLEKELRARLHQQLGARLNEKGWLLYSGLDTLRAGRYYFMGFNPAKDPANEPLDSVTLFNENWSAYTKQCWSHSKDRCTCDPIVQKIHQRRVSGFMRELNSLSPEEIFATNAIFIESETVVKLADRETLWEKCWRLHQWMLSIVRPQWIVCLGNQEDSSSFSLLRERTRSPVTVGALHDYRKGKIFRGSLPIEHGEMLNVQVLGLPHPSRFNLPAAASIPGLLS